MEASQIILPSCAEQLEAILDYLADQAAQHRMLKLEVMVANLVSYANELRGQLQQTVYARQPGHCSCVPQCVSKRQRSTP